MHIVSTSVSTSIVLELRAYLCETAIQTLNKIVHRNLVVILLQQNIKHSM